MTTWKMLGFLKFKQKEVRMEFLTLILLFVFIGACIGYIMALFLRLFFEDEIFEWIETIVLRVRKKFGLE